MDRGQGPSGTATNTRYTRLARVFVGGGVTGEDHPDALSSSRSDGDCLTKGGSELGIGWLPVAVCCPGALAAGHVPWRVAVR